MNILPVKSIERTHILYVRCGFRCSWVDFRETQVGRIYGPFELVFMPVSCRGFALFRTSVSSGKGLTLIINDLIL